MAADRTQPVPFHHRPDIPSLRHRQAVQIPTRQLPGGRHAAVAMGRRRHDRARLRQSPGAWPPDTSGRIHSFRRDGFRLFHREFSAQLLSGDQQRRIDHHALLRLPLPRNGGRWLDQPGRDARRDNLSSELAADQAVDRIAAAALEEDGDAQERPQQRELVTATGPEIAELPLEKQDDDQHLDADHGGGDAGEKADRETRGRNRLGEIGQVGQGFRKRQSLGRDILREFVDGNVEDLCHTMRQQDRAGGKAHDRVGEWRQAVVEAGERRKNQLRPTVRCHGSPQVFPPLQDKARVRQHPTRLPIPRRSGQLTIARACQSCNSPMNQRSRWLLAPSVGDCPSESMMSLDRYSAAYQPYLLSLFRFITGLLLFQYGIAKIFKFPPLPYFANPPPLIMTAGAIELVLGGLLAVGLLTRLAAFVLSGEMAFAYFLGHMFKTGEPVFHPLNNGGTAAILFCFACLYLSASGGGPISVDAAIGARSRPSHVGDEVGHPAE